MGEAWDHPAETLHSIYKLEGFAWHKTGNHVKRTVEAIDMNSLYMTARGRAPSLSSFISSLEAALFP
jgi:hypothetical protein